MTSAETQKPACPVCHQTDQVKTTQAAYSAGITRCAPPDMPTRNISMIPYISSCMVLVGICVFCIIVFIGGAEGGVPSWIQLAMAIITILSIIITLVVSYYAFQRVVRGDVETTELLPAWDKAMAEWKNLYYCSRDDVVFNSEADKVVSNEQLATLREFKNQSNGLHSAVPSH